MPKRKSKFERMKDRLKEDMEIDCFRFERTYPSEMNRVSGGPVWTARLVESPSREIGSSWTVTELLKKKEKLTRLDIDWWG